MAAEEAVGAGLVSASLVMASEVSVAELYVWAKVTKKKWILGMDDYSLRIGKGLGREIYFRRDVAQTEICSWLRRLSIEIY